MQDDDEYSYQEGRSQGQENRKMRQNNEEKEEIIEVSEEMKQNGFVYHAPDSFHPLYQKANKISDHWTIAIREGVK